MKIRSLSGLFVVALALAPGAVFAVKTNKKVKKTAKVKVVSAKTAKSADSAKAVTDENIQKSLQNLSTKSHNDQIDELVRLASQADAGDFTGKTHRAVGNAVASVLKENNELATAMRNLLVQASTSPLLAQVQQQYVTSTLIPRLPQAMQNVPALGQASADQKKLSKQDKITKKIKKARTGKVKLKQGKKVLRKAGGKVDKKAGQKVGGQKVGKKMRKKGKSNKVTQGASTATASSSVSTDPAVAAEAAAQN